MYVVEQHRCMLKCLWWPDGDYTKNLKEYEMCVHVFGAVSSGSCASYALRKTASENEGSYGRMAAETLKRNFYVDDMLKSTPNTNSGVELTKNVVAMCKAGGFNLTKFVSTEKNILNSLPHSKVAPILREYDLSKGTLLIERALGVLWCIESDELKFRIEFHDTPLSRKGMLSTISSVYDPSGIVGPFILPGRKVLQEVVHEKKSWNEKVSDQHRMKWQKWKTKLHMLEDVRIPRCLKPPGFGKSVSTTIHNFADASEIGYGVASYMRQVNEKGEVSVSLLMGKSRVSPMAATPIPRLELTAAVTAANISNLINEELDLCRQTICSGQIVR